MTKHDLATPVILRRRGYFWRVVVTEASVNYSHGRGDGVNLPPNRNWTRNFSTVAEAAAWASQAIDDKLNDGYIPTDEYDPDAEAASLEAEAAAAEKTEKSADVLASAGSDTAQPSSSQPPSLAANSASNANENATAGPTGPRRSSRRRAPPPAPVPTPAPPASRAKRKTASNNPSATTTAATNGDDTSPVKRTKRGHAGAAPVDTTRALGVVDPVANVPGGIIYVATTSAPDGSIVSHVHDAMLALVDLARRHDKFIVLQLIETVAGDYVLFERWGRTGTAGQSMRVEFKHAQLADARRKFEAKFVQKTGLEWALRAETPIHGKYRFVTQDYVAKNEIAIQQGLWQYWVDDGVDGKPTGWYNYDSNGNKLTEQLYLEYQSNSWLYHRIVQSGMYAYLVNLQTLTQTNISLPTNTSRFIRRVASTETPSTAPPPAVIAVVNQMAAAAGMNAVAANQPSQGKGPAPVATKTPKVEPASVVNNPTSLPANTPPSMDGTKDGVAKSEPEVQDERADDIQAFDIPVDDTCPDSNKYAVVDDYDAMLNQTNIMGKNNNNKYYKLQLLVLKNEETFYVWTRWGRVGEARGVQTKLMGPFQQVEKASKAFNKKFREKSGNDWNNRADFNPVVGKYELVRIDHSVKKEEQDEPLIMKLKGGDNDVEILPSTLPRETAELIELLFEKDMYMDAMREFDIDVRKMPLGQLSTEQVERGVEVLEQLKAEITGQKRQPKLEELSSKFYTTLPHDFGRRKPPIIFTEEMVQKCFDMCNVLLDMETANSLMEKAESNLTEQKVLKKVPHPTDTQYESLHADLQLVQEDSEEFKDVKAAFEETKGHHSSELKHVWRVNREGEGNRYSALGIDNDTLLWHGTHVGTVAAILSTGLRIMPHSGGRVGKGIYLASENGKSQQYTTPAGNKRIGCMFLAQAALGKVHEIKEDDPSLTKPPNGFNSVRACGKQAPTSYKTITIDNKPVRIAVQKAEIQEGNESSSFWHDEFLVYNEAQARLRYVIAMKC